MSLKLYMDVHVPQSVTNGLNLVGVDVLTSQEDRTTTFPDSRLLNRATALQRVLFSQDRDFLTEASKRQRSGANFAGLIYLYQEQMIVGQCIEDLELICKAYDPKDILKSVLDLPLK